ncbi:hypothetical protein AK812_SmicGene5718 [Symbiodinium microadriaticum]|uniref:Uncharacterized protein n=1 Tax=Symbiodinium microadriaticum TaxID=2951 RepID=A0A1Q9ESZ0_SYMMI|nr:hypothetical protein AK812_SmicGene5718 [Symbiodinium microadriaticum]
MHVGPLYLETQPQDAVKKIPLNRHPPDEDPGLEDLDFAPPRKMANIRAAAEHRRQQSSQREPPAEESAELADDVANSWLRSSDAEKPRQTDIRAIAERRAAGFRNAAPGGSRTPGSATRTPTPRGGVYKPSHLYSGRAAAVEKPESAF